jgi:hypothetical protein
MLDTFRLGLYIRECRIFFEENTVSELEIDLTGYDSDFGYRNSYAWRGSNRQYPASWRLAHIDEARRAAKESGITRVCAKIDKIALKVPTRVERITSDFLMHFLGPAARKLTPAALKNKLVLRTGGQDVDVSNSLDTFSVGIRCYLERETVRIVERAKKKTEKKPENIVWGEPIGLYVPDINTKLRLALPWNFTIFREHRNEKFLRFIMQDPNFNGWKYRDSGNTHQWQVQLDSGSIIIVDRVYIRRGKGFEDFSSLTFRLQKGSTLVYNGDMITAKGNHRFWAKLRDVNKIVAEVDLNSLPGQEKEGTARKD